MAKVMNAADKLVQEALDGMLASSPHLARLDGYPDIKVVIHSAHDKNKVACISGGGSGHEPAHAGYVGPGMLAAAVAGEVFASPPTNAVLAAIRAVTGPAGCLLIIKNYTGDRLNFGLAAEQAKAEGYQVEMVVVGEDVAIEKPGLAGRRGLAGTVLVHKVAGAVASSGAPLAAVVAAAQQVADSCATLGVALRVCSLPGKPPSDRIKPGHMEIGLGIHGEPGAEQVPVMSAHALVQRMLSHITSSPFFSLKAGDRVVLLLNNLGATTPLEMGCVAHEALQQLANSAPKVHVARLVCGFLMTSLDMAGFSITLLRLPAGQQADTLLAHLDAAVGASGWSATTCAPVSAPTTVHVPHGAGGVATGAAAHGPRPEQLTAAEALLERVIHRVGHALLASADHLNDLDAKVGDGDCGDTLAHAARAVLHDLATHYPLNDPAATIKALAHSVRSAVGGTSGVLYDVALTAAAASLKASATVDGDAWASALAAGVRAIAKYGGAQPGSRTMLDALLPACQALQQALQEPGTSVAAAVDAMAEAAEHGAQATAAMAATAGRASYVPESVLRSNPDPGALAVSRWMAAVAEAIKDESGAAISS